MIIYPELKEKLDKVIIDVEKDMETHLHTPTRIVVERDLFDSMKYTALAKSKRIRPFLVLEVAKLFGVPKKQALTVASAVEFVHAYSLIHDDLPAMDNSNTRRGQPSNHKKYNEYTAILAGDALIPLAYEVISNHRYIPDAEIRCDLVSELSKTIGAKGMVGGQMLDMVGEEKELTYKTMQRMQTLKTGKMFIFSCMAGAILGGATKEEKKALYDYADKLGRVFQITDDILDEIGDEKLVGKPLRRDQINKKNTFISVFSLVEAKAEAEKLIAHACNDLKDFKKDTTLLEELAKFLLIRTY